MVLLRTVRPYGRRRSEMVHTNYFILPTDKVGKLVAVVLGPEGLGMK